MPKGLWRYPNKLSMTREEFKKFVDRTLDEVKQYAEVHSATSLSAQFKFKWLKDDCPTVYGRQQVIEEIVRLVFVSPDQIYPCVDLNIDLDEEYISLTAWIANYDPRPFQKGWTNRPGPFIYCINHRLISDQIDPQSAAFKRRLVDLGLIHTLNE